MGLYIDNYRPWPDWVVEGNEEIALRFPAQIGTYRGHADNDPGHDMSGDLAADFFLYVNTKAEHDRVLAWFQANAVRIGATYIITWRRIWSVARAAEGIRAYSGDDPHTGHIHVSYGTIPPEEDMPTVKEIWVGAEADVIKSPDGEDTWQPGSYLRNIYLRVDTLEATVSDLNAKLDTLLARVPQPPSTP